MEQMIRALLPADYPWADRFSVLPEVDSTNLRLKEAGRMGAPHGTVLIAQAQTLGRGRLGRSFHSPAGLGVYLSILLRPSCAAQELMHLTCAAGCAMCDAVEQAAGFRPEIKWTNDLVKNRKKLGGILVEMAYKPNGELDFAVVGIGINCCHMPEDFPEEISGMASSLSQIAGHPVSREVLAAAMMGSLHRMDQALLSGKDTMIARYRKDCITIGQEISLIRGDEVRHGKAIDVDEQGALIVIYPDGTQETVSCGEVSIRGMYGYI